jgi:hypothetical protein
MENRGVRMRAKSLFVYLAIIFLFILHLPITAHAIIELEILPPTQFIRGTGKPVTDTGTFSYELGGPAKLRLRNGGHEGSSAKRVSSSIISLNNKTLCDPSDFNQNVSDLEKEIILNSGENTLEVELRGKPSGEVWIEVILPVDADGAGIVGTGGGTIEAHNGLIYLLPNAVDEEVLISITNTPISEVIDGKETLGRTEFEPTALTFSESIICIMPIAKELVPGQVVDIDIYDEISGTLKSYIYFDGSISYGIVLDDGVHVAFFASHFSTYFASEIVPIDQVTLNIDGDNKTKLFIPRTEIKKTVLDGDLYGLLKGLRDHEYRKSRYEMVLRELF